MIAMTSVKGKKYNSRFHIAFEKQKSLNNKHVCFACVAKDSINVLKAIERHGDYIDERLPKRILITGCGGEKV